MPADKTVLVIAPRPPDPDGTPADRSLFRLLSRLARAAKVRCLPHAPPSSWRTLKAVLAAGGVEIAADWAAPPPGDFFETIRRAVRSHDYSAVLVSGGQAAGAWLKPLRMLAPERPIVCHLPDAAELLALAAKPGEPGALDPRTRWMRILSFADAVWVDEPSDALRLHRAGLLHEGPTAVFATRNANAPALSTALSRVAKTRGSSSAAQVDAKAGGVAGINRALRALKAELVWISAHDFKPSQNLFTTLCDGMRVLPFAGGAAPVECARKPGAKAGVREDLLEAAWALGRKGDWHEVDHLSHFCCLVLRRRAVEAAGLLDERFLDPQYALIDYCLRLQQAGWPVYQARDALAFCREKRPAPGASDAEQRDLLVEKWSRGSLKLMESLSTALEPKGYRLDPTVAAGFKGPKK